MKSQIENLEERALMNSAPVLSDVVLAASGIDEQRIESIGKCGSEWVDSHLAADSPPLSPFVVDAAAAGLDLSDYPWLDEANFVANIAANKAAGDSQKVAGAGHDAAFEAEGDDWLSVRFDEVSADISAPQADA